MDRHNLAVGLTFAMGYILGMLLFTCVMAVIQHRNSKVEQNFIQAAKIYLIKDTGPIITAIIFLFVMLFVLPELLGPGDTEIEHDNAVHLTFQNLRYWSLAIGFCGQFIPFMFLSKAAKYFKSQSDDITPPPSI